LGLAPWCEGVKVGDLVEVTYTRALAIALDKPAKK
jgi:hypothetical protein